MSELQAQHCIAPEQWSRLLRSVSATPVKKSVLAGIKSFNRNQDADFELPKNFWVLVPISRGETNARFVPHAAGP